MTCLHCKTKLIPHEGTGAKNGALHCYGCGCCFMADGKTPREGVPLCAASAMDAEPEPEPDPAEAAPVEEKPAPSRGRSR